jgi:ribokinase
VTTPRPTGRVIVVGSVNVDLFVTTDHLPVPGETVIGGTFAEHDGGKGGNQAVAAARLGAATWFVGAVGDDPYGQRARSALEGDGVDGSAIAVMPEVATGVAFILVDADGENLIAVASGANGALSPAVVRDALDRLAPGPGDVVLVCHEIPTATAAEALRAGRAGGATTILNPAPADGLDAATLALADIITPNAGEAARLTTTCGPLGELVPAVLTSHGADGAALATTEGTTVLPGLVVEAVDTVGAGDTLNGALACGLAEGRTLEDAARRAVAAASLAVTRPGARGGMPTAAELEAALAR